MKNKKRHYTNMKELTIEEKAKAYDKAFKRAKGLYAKGAPDSLYLEQMFPELRENKESEDERIRKELIHYFSDGVEFLGLCSFSREEIITWLEKQGEQKPADKVEPKFNVGDWVVVSTAMGDRVVQIASVGYLKEGHPSYFTTEGRWFDNRTKARLLTDKDMETITIPESKFIDKNKEWNEEDNNYIDSCCLLIGAVDDTYDKVFKDNCIHYLQSLKERFGK